MIGGSDFGAFWRRLITLGADRTLDYPTRRRIVLVNQAAILGVLIATFYAFASLFYEPVKLWPFIVGGAFEVAAFSFILWLNHARRPVLARFASIIAPTGLILLASWLLGNSSGSHLYFFVLWTVAFLLYVREERWLFLMGTGLWVTSYIWIQMTMDVPYIQLEAGERFTSGVFLLNTLGSFGLVGAVLAMFYSEINRTEKELQRQYQRSEDLLANILPASVAEELKNRPDTIARGFSDVTLLFADIVGFTKLAQKLSPRELVELLNQVFSRFDLLVERLGLEKIKTIGDEYMLVGGLPEPSRGHAAAVAEAALQMMEAIEKINEKTGRDLSIRIGIHSGEVVAGVIGTRKFSYDVWGDTVNTASRMQSQSSPGAIQVSEVSYEKLKHAYEFKSRGLLRVKGKGKMKTWYLTGRKFPI